MNLRIHLSATKRSLLLGMVLFALLAWSLSHSFPSEMDALLIGGQALAFFLILRLATSYRAAFALGLLAFVIQATLYLPAHNSTGNSLPFCELLRKHSSNGLVDAHVKM